MNLGGPIDKLRFLSARSSSRIRSCEERNGYRKSQLIERKLVGRALEPSEKSEQELVQRLKDKDPAAFEIFVRAHAGSMLAVARRIVRDETIAEDCVQEALLSVYRNIEKFEGRSALGSWVHQITVNAALNQLKKQKGRKELSLDPLLPMFDDGSLRVEPRVQVDQTPEDIVGNEKLRKYVLEQIESLPDPFRVVLILRDIEGFSTSEVADFLGDTVAAIKTRLHRARSALKKLLEPIWSEDR